MDGNDSYSNIHVFYKTRELRFLRSVLKTTAEKWPSGCIPGAVIVFCNLIYCFVTFSTFPLSLIKLSI